MALKYVGSTSEFARVGEGVVLKYPRKVPRETFLREDRPQLRGRNPDPQHFTPTTQDCQNKGEGDPRGILLAEANKGDLQRYLDSHEDEIPLRVRQSWCLQVVEAVAYIHEQGVIHSDLRPENFLVHEKEPGCPEIWLCDFGGSTCEKLGLDSGQLPDSGFFDPNSEWISTRKTDIFSFASILYSIMTGHWPCRQPGPFTSAKEMEKYEGTVDTLFEQGPFPSVDGLFAGKVIMKGWKNEYSTMDEVFQDISDCMLSS